MRAFLTIPSSFLTSKPNLFSSIIVSSSNCINGLLFSRIVESYWQSYIYLHHKNHTVDEGKPADSVQRATPYLLLCGSCYARIGREVKHVSPVKVGKWIVTMRGATTMNVNTIGSMDLAKSVLSKRLKNSGNRWSQSPKYAKGSVILHSDRGSQFTSHEYQTFLTDHQIVSSMSAVGSCYDNAAAEIFWTVEAWTGESTTVFNPGRGKVRYIWLYRTVL